MSESKLIKLSASAIKTYEQCPRKYYYSYINKPDIEKKDWSHLELGKFVHDVLESFHNILMRDPSHLWPELMSSMCKKMVSKYKLGYEDKAKAKEMLAGYLKKLDKEGLPNVIANEQSFSFKISEDVLIRGFIDRLDRLEDENKEYEIVDYKTGKSTYLDEFQLLVYGLYILKENPDIERFKGTYVALAEGSKDISYIFTRTDVERVRQKILGVAKAIREDQTWQTKPQFLCGYCDFNKVCPDSPHKEASNDRREW